MNIDLWPRSDGTATVQLDVRGITARPLEIRHAGRVLWSGEIGPKLQTVSLPPVPLVHGHVQLELSSPAAPVREGADARALGFAVYGVRVTD